MNYPDVNNNILIIFSHIWVPAYQLRSYNFFESNYLSFLLKQKDVCFFIIGTIHAKIKIIAPFCDKLAFFITSGHCFRMAFD